MGRWKRLRTTALSGERVDLCVYDESRYKLLKQACAWIFSDLQCYENRETHCLRGMKRPLPFSFTCVVPLVVKERASEQLPQDPIRLKPVLAVGMGASIMMCHSDKEPAERHAHVSGSPIDDPSASELQRHLANIYKCSRTRSSFAQPFFFGKSCWRRKWLLKYLLSG